MVLKAGRTSVVLVVSSTTTTIRDTVHVPVTVPGLPWTGLPPRAASRPGH